MRKIFIPVILTIAVLASAANVMAVSYRVSGSGSADVDGVYVKWLLCNNLHPTRGPVMSYMKPGTPYRIGYRGCQGSMKAGWIIATENPTVGNNYNSCGLFFHIGPTSPYYARNNNYDALTPPREGWDPKEGYCLGLQTGDPAVCPEPTVTPIYSLVVATQGSGSVTLNPPGGSYDADTVVTLTATPSTHWTFSGWSGAVTGSTNPITVTMDSDKTVTATFVGNKTDLIVTTVGSGTVALNPPGGTYDEGTVVALAAVPENDYWEFSGWSGDLTGSVNPTSITVDSRKTVTATFTLTDSDNDGTSDLDEDAGPNGGDGDNDGTADRLQANVLALRTHNGQNTVVLVSPTGTRLCGCRAMANPDPGGDPPYWVEFSYGFFEFTIEGVGSGGSATVTLHLPSGATPNAYYKYGPTPDNPGSSTWYKFKKEGGAQTGAEFSGNVVTLHFIDGQLGDDDLSENGSITDQGGPGIVDSGTSGDQPSGPRGGGSASGGGGGVMGGCFVAAAGPGGRTEAYLWVLHEFGDRYLLTTEAGRLFIRAYRAYLPYLSALLNREPVVRTVLQWGLPPLAGLCYIALKLGIVPTLVLTALVLTLLSAGLFALRRRMRLQRARR